MKLNRAQLRNFIKEIIVEGYGIDTATREREVGNSSFNAAQADAKKNGKAYFVQDDQEVVTFTGDEANIDPNMTPKDAFDANDGTVHYTGNL